MTRSAEPDPFSGFVIVRSKKPHLRVALERFALTKQSSIDAGTWYEKPEAADENDPKA